MAIPHSEIVILLSVEKTSVCLAKSSCFVAFHTMEISISVCLQEYQHIFPHIFPVCQTRQITASWLVCNHQFLCKGTKCFYCHVVNNIPPISVCKLSNICITLKTVEWCTNPHTFYSEVTITMITVNYFWPRNSVLKELEFCCNWKLTLKYICFVRNLIGPAF